MHEYAWQIAKKQAQIMLKKVFPELKEDKIPILYPPNETAADLAIPLFNLAKEKNESPVNLATHLAERKDLLPELFSDAKAEKGYLNLYINWHDFSPLVFSDFDKWTEKYGSSQLGEGKTIVIDYSSPNIAKPFSVGHLRSTIIGHALCNIFKFLGYYVIGDNHLGDWGTQFGKLICAYKNWGDQEAIKTSATNELLRLYVKFHQTVEENPSARATLESEARAWFRKLEQKDKEALAIWQWFKELSWKEFERIYELLGIKFDYVYGESHYNEMLQDIIREATDKGIAQWSPAHERYTDEEISADEKVLLISLEDYGIKTPLLIQKSDGTSLYQTRDLAAARYRFQKWHPEQIIYVVGTEQSLYFQQLFKVLELLGYRTKCVHVVFGLLRLPGGRMSTRKGNVILLEDVLNEAIKRAKNILLARDISDEDKETIARIVGIGAVKYADLSQLRTKDVIFNWDKMLSLEGDSAPYIQYAYTRSQSILKKSEDKSLENISPALLSKIEEINLIKRIGKFPEVINQAGERYEPNRIANYLFDLAREFNKFYTELPVLKAESDALRQARLKLVAIVGSILKSGLAILGIEVPEKM